MNIDKKLLKEHREDLANVIHKARTGVITLSFPEIESLEGVLNLIDTIPDDQEVLDSYPSRSTMVKKILVNTPKEEAKTFVDRVTRLAVMATLSDDRVRDMYDDMIRKK